MNWRGFAAGLGGGGFVMRHFVGNHSVLEFCIKILIVKQLTELKRS